MPAKLNTSVAVDPCETVIEVEAGVTVRTGESVTVSGRFMLDEYVVPDLPATLALSTSVGVPAEALALPVSVNVHETAPAVVTLAALHAAVMPVGKPEAMLIVEPVAPVGIVTPPKGVAVIVMVVEAAECIEAGEGEAAS